MNRSLKPSPKPKNIFSFTRKLLAVTVFSSIAFTTLHLTANHSHASSTLTRQMDHMFSSMSNVTNPGFHQSARRGVISGGSIRTRNKVITTQLMQITPPSFNGGCGGIDFFGGSFSFINHEQFVALARAVAANAISFAFYAAIGAMSPEIKNIMVKLQEFIDYVNRFMVNSCEMAQGVVNDTLAAVGKQRLTDASLTGSIKEGKDHFDQLFGIGSSNASPASMVQDEDNINQFYGNIVWKALVEARSNGHVLMENASLMDKDAMELIMSVTGYFTIAEDDDAQSISGNVLSFMDLVNGHEAAVFFTCPSVTSLCHTPTTRTQTLKGFSRIYIDRMIGSDTQPGIIQKKLNDQDLTAAEIAFTAALPGVIGSSVNKLIRLNPSLAEYFITATADFVALKMAYELFDSYFKTIRTSIATQGMSSDYRIALDIIESSERRFRDDYKALSSSTITEADVIQFRDILLRGAQPRPIMPPDTGSSGSIR